MLVILIVMFFIMIIFKNYFYGLYKFNTISILSSILLILDVCYKERISNKVIKIIYKKLFVKKI